MYIYRQLKKKLTKTNVRKNVSTYYQSVGDFNYLCSKYL